LLQDTYIKFMRKRAFNFKSISVLNILAISIAPKLAKAGCNKYNKNVNIPTTIPYITIPFFV